MEASETRRGFYWKAPLLFVLAMAGPILFWTLRILYGI